MSHRRRTKRRGFVMTGGGAKGLYEAGVVHAFHLTGMNFDVITGSSIGALNSVFFAEYLLRKKGLPADVRDDPEAAVEAMDDLVKAYHHAWLQMPEKRIVDDSATGPLGRLKDDLARFQICLPDLTHLMWWWTDPKRSAMPSPRVWPALVRLGKELVERLGGAGEVLTILKHGRDAPFEQAMRTYLARFGIERSLVPPEEDPKLASILTDPIAPLRRAHLEGKRLVSAAAGVEKTRLIQPGRTMRDYAQAGIDLRLTRANYRTGRLEVSAYVSTEDFVRYMEKQAFRLEGADPERIPLGSFRLEVPGNPDAVNAALASGRFPGVLAPYPVAQIYLPDDPENEPLHRMLTDWLDDPQVASEMDRANRAVHGDEAGTEERWERTYERWRASEDMRDFFPRSGDVYVDGGAIDNTPSNSAIDATREWADEADVSRRDLVLDLYVVFLHPEPRVDPVEIGDPAFHQVIGRTREIQGAAKLSSDAVVVDTINTFGRRGEQLGETLMALLASTRETLQSMDEGERRGILERLREDVRQRGIRGYRGADSEGILDRMADWAEDILDTRLPLQVTEVTIHPEEMPLSTLQFTERLGYRHENAVAMLTMGCYNTLSALRDHLEREGDSLDEQERQSLALARKWMGGADWPPEPEGSEGRAWQCRRTACVFHSDHCPYGGRS